MRATVITDASWCPNTRAGGWAAWATVNSVGAHGIPVTRRIKRYGTFHENPKSSTEAEHWAAWNGIWIAYDAGARDILCQTDCLAVVRSPGTGRRDGNWRDLCSRYWPEATIRFRHVRGHTSRDEPRFYVNRWCDEHAKKVMRRRRESIR